MPLSPMIFRVLTLLKGETFSIPSYHNINSLLSDLDDDGNNLVIVENLYLRSLRIVIRK